jgi:DNA replication protein DnaC
MVSPIDCQGCRRRLRALELLVVAKTQRWKPEEFLRTLVEAEIAARDASNARNRLRAAAFPVTKTLEEFDLVASSVGKASFDYLASLEWIAARENPCLLGPAGTGKSHLLVALGHAAVDAGHRVRDFSAADERVSLGVASHWPFDQWVRERRFLPEPTTAVSLLDRLLHHSVVVLTDGKSFRMREAKTKGGSAKS